MNDLDMTLLTEEQIFGKNQLGIFKKHDTRCAITDFAILLGGNVSSNMFTSEGNALKDRASVWWTKTPYEFGGMCISACTVDTYGNSNSYNVTGRWPGARPALSYSLIKPFVTKKTINQSGIEEVEFGEYLQTIVVKEFSKELEKKYNNGTDLRRTGKTYTTDSVPYYDHDKSFIPRKHEEYEYNGSKYIRFVGDENCNKETLLSKTLSYGREAKPGEIYCVRVEPVKWLVDEENDIALSKKILFSGVQFQRTEDYKGDFNRTDIKQFMDNYFSKEIMPSTISYPYKNEIINELKHLLADIRNISEMYDINFEDIVKETSKQRKR